MCFIRGSVWVTVIVWSGVCVRPVWAQFRWVSIRHSRVKDKDQFANMEGEGRKGPQCSRCLTPRQKVQGYGFK